MNKNDFFFNWPGPFILTLIIGRQKTWYWKNKPSFFKIGQLVAESW